MRINHAARHSFEHLSAGRRCPRHRQKLISEELTIVTMPHFGLIDESLDPAEASLLRARLHVRGANIRLERGQIADAVAAFYDAFSTAMELHLLTGPDELKQVTDDRSAFMILRSVGIIDSSTPMEEFDLLEDALERAIEGDVQEINMTRFLNTIEPLLERLGIIPFDNSSLPQAESVTT
jgi:hypothetical protein